MNAISFIKNDMKKAGGTKGFWGLLALIAFGICIVYFLIPHVPHVKPEANTFSEFLFEIRKCFARGFLWSTLFGVFLSILIYCFFPLPDRMGRFALCLTSTMLGIVLLSLRCAQSSTNHILFSHWGHLLLVVPVLYFLQKTWLNWKIHQALGGTVSRLKKIYKVFN